MRIQGALFCFCILLLVITTSLGAQPCGTPGRDGSGTITGTVNTYYPGTATAAAGATSLSVGSPSGAATAIGAGDLLLVIQMQDAAINSNNSGSYGDGGGGDPATGTTALNNTGIYEFVVATGPVASGSLPFLGGGSGGKLLNTYTVAAATGTQGQRRFQVIRVPQYSSATLSSGLTALAWNGSVGGVLSIDVSGTLALGGATVSLDGKGFRGGGGRSLNGDGSVHDYRCLSTGNAHGSKAEGIAGTPRWVYDGTTLTDTGVEGYPNGSYCKGAPGNAGGGGTDDSTTNSNNSGGGGGANGGTGGRGGNTWTSNIAQGGFGGTAFAATAARLALGGGGGAGTSNNAGPAHGGVGGGLILFRFNARSGTGTLSANGTTPPDSSQDGAGGGGAGGTVFATACTAGNLTNLTVHAQGARGGNVNWTAGDFHGPGGGGGGGAVFLSGTAAAVSVTAGANGTSPTTTAYGATSGTAGTSSTAATTSSAPGARPGCVCALTQALITDFHSVPQGNAAVVEWQTSSEAATAGFYLFRVDPATGAWKRLNERLLSPVTEAPQGGVYQLLDESASPREAASYALVEVQNDGRQRTYGPFRVVPDGRSSLVTLSRIGADGYARAPRRPQSRSAALETKAIVKPGQPTPGNALGLKLFVRESGIYVLTAAQIASNLGVPQATATDWITQHRLGLANQGLSVPWQAAPDNTSLRFFGEASSSQYAAENVYQLLAGSPGSAMRTVDGGTPAAVVAPPFRDTVHYEQDNFAGIAIAPDPDSDYWFWDVLIAGDPSYGARNLPLDVHGVAGSGTATLTVHLQGATSTGTAGEHRVTVNLNGSILGDVVWQQVQPATATFTFNPSLLREGSNSVALTAQLQPGIPYSISYLESFDLGYDRLERADGAPLFLRPAAGAAVTVTGFASPQVLVYDVTQAKSATAVTGTTVDSTAGGYRVSFRPAAAGRLYVALDAGSLRTPRIVPWSPPVTSLVSTANGADHLIITPADLAGAAESLASYRRSQGLDSRVVTVEQIWDEFNGGLPDPHALQRFLAFAATAWSKRPTSVVLAGKGTYDYRDHLGLGGNLVPPLMVRASEGLFASDSQLAAGTGIVIGRLPVTSAAQLQSVVDKLIAYESASAGDWQRQVLMVADNPDPGGQFDWESDLSAALVPSTYRSTRLYLGTLSLADLRRQLLAGLGSGAFLVSYIGHGGLDRLAAEPILANDDAANLNNGDRLPVVAAMACIIGRFEVPGFTAFAETLIDNPHGGAVAVWAPSGVDYNAQSGTLDRALFAQLFKEKATTLGDVVRGAAAGFLAAGGSGNTLLTYNLFGDPATRLRRGD